MSARHAFLIPALMGALLAVTAAGAAASVQQDELDHDLDRAKVLYGEGHFDEAVTSLRVVIVRLEELADLQSRKERLADAHVLLGLAHLAMRQESDGLEQFRQVLALDDTRRLDPDVFAPRVVALFERARGELSQEAAKRLPATQPVGASSSPPRDLMPRSNIIEQGPPLNSGARVRLAFRDGRDSITGNVVFMSDAAVTLINTENQQRLSFARSTVTRVDVLQRRRGHFLAGGIAGAALGATIGAFETPGCEGNDGDCYSRGENIGYGSLGFGIVGALIGALCKTDEWAELPLHGSVTASTSSRSGKRVELAFAVALRH